MLESISLYKLIKCLRENGVKEFKFDQLQIVFGEETTLIPKTPTIRRTKASQKKAEEIAQQSLIKENIETTEDGLSMLLIEDPSEYERLIREGVLEDEKEGTQNIGSESDLQ